MNKKIIAGLMSVAAVGSFWACGSGDINEPDMADEYMSMSFVPNGVPDKNAIMSTLINPAKKNCVGDCAIIYADVLADQGAPSNPSENNGNNSNTSNGNGSGNSAGNGTNSGTTGTGTPNNPIIINPSAGDNGNSGNTGDSGSGSGTTETPVITPSDGFGTCAATTGVTAVGKGEPVAFKFNLDKTLAAGLSISDIGAITYEWNYGSGTSDGTENKAISSKVTFTESGDPIVAVTVSVPGKDPKTVSCPIHVNGDPITGCTCEAAAGSVDFTQAGAAASWTVSGCQSASDQFTYEWTGVTGNGASASYTFAKAESVIPKLVVHNNDNSILDVTCPAVKGTEGAEYTIDIKGGQYSNSVKIEGEGCVVVKGTWDNAGWKPSPKLQCNGSNVTITYGGKSWSNVGINNGSITSDPLKELFVTAEETVFFDDVCVVAETFAECTLTN